jgi:hypothetical protein
VSEGHSMNILQLLRASVRDVLGARRWLGIQFAGDIGVGLAVFGWLSLPDRSVWDVAASLALFLLILAAFFLLNAATFAALRRRVQTGQRASLKAVLPPFSMWMALILGISALIFTFRPFEPATTASSGVFLPAAAAPQPELLEQSIRCGLAMMFFLFLLPNLSRVAGAPQPARRTYELLRDWQYWVSAGAIGAVAVVAANLLVWWVPGVSGLPAQTASMVVRFTFALLIKVFAWMLLAALCAHLYVPANPPDKITSPVD